jgi:hypothetical protein
MWLQIPIEISTCPRAGDFMTLVQKLSGGTKLVLSKY